MDLRQARSTVLLAGLAAAALIAQQVGGKATRDAFFLTHFDVTSVPVMIMAAAGVSITVVLLTAGMMTRLGPARLLPAGLLLSAVLHLGEWGLAAVAPRPAAVLFYLHAAVIGLVLISGFWGLVTERFDPRTARRRMSLIAAGATVGGMAGGFLADRTGAALSVTAMFPVLAALHGGGALLVTLFIRATRVPDATPRKSEAGSTDPRYGFRVFREVRYLRDLARLVALTTMGGVLVAYVFQAEAVAAYPDGEQLIRFFAIFYTVVSVVTFLLQTGVSRPLLERVGLTVSVASQPLCMAGAGLIALFVPGLQSAAFAFGSITVLGNSTYRSGYELHYSAIPRKKKRATKTIVDVGVTRLGDALGGGLVKLVLAVGALAYRPVLLGMAAGIGLAALLVVRRLQRGYVLALEESLINRALDLELDEVTDSTTRETMLRTLTGLKLDPELVKRVREQAGEAADPAPAPAAGELRDPLVQRILVLRSGDPERIRNLLSGTRSLDPALAPMIVRLLAWDEVAEFAIRALVGIGPRITGQLADALLDPEEEFAIRRRVPRVLVEFWTERSARALFRGLGDRRFEVRFQCGRALARIQGGGLRLPFADQEVFSAVLNEVKVDRRVWVGRRLLERLDDSKESVFVDEVLRDRANRSLEHVFTLLSLTLPREPLKVAFRGLHTRDRALRGTALEYLESVLPTHVRRSLWPFLEGRETPRTPERSREQILEDLLRSNDSIRIDLKEVGGTPEPPGS